MRTSEPAAALLRDYPRIFFACHRRHTRDPKTKTIISEKQSQILDHLDEIDPISLSGLAAHMGVTLGTMSVAVERLVANRLVSRSTDPADQRRVLLRLTRAGARISQAHSVLDPEKVESLLARLSREERTRAIEGLALLAKAAGIAADSGSSRSQRRIA